LTILAGIFLFAGSNYMRSMR